MRIVAIIVLALLALAGADSVFVVREGHAAIVSQFGRIQQSAVGPGLHFKAPFLQQTDVYDTRAIVTESEPEHYQTTDGDLVQIGFYARWRIADPVAYYRASSAEELQATQQMTPLIRDALRSQVQAHSLSDLIAGDNGAIGTRLRTLVDNETRARLGIQMLDVGIERIEFPDESIDAVYKRMRADAKSSATALRAAAQEKAADIRADGQQKTQQLLAQARKDAATTRGEGDAAAAKIYADAGAQDPLFFSFWSNLQTYRKAFGNGRSVIVLDRDSPLLKDLGMPGTAPAKTH